MKSRSKPRPQQRKPGGRKWKPKSIGNRFATLAEEREAIRLGHPDAKVKRAWKPNKWDRGFVERCTAYGLIVKQISQLIEDRYGCTVDENYISRVFAKELAIGREKCVTEIADRLYNKAKKGSVAAMTFFLKTKGRWSTTLQLADPSGRPLQPPKVTVQFGKDDDEDGDGES